MKEDFGCVYLEDDCVGCVKPFTYDCKYGVCYIPGCKNYNKDGCEYCNQPFRKENNLCVIDYC